MCFSRNSKSVGLMHLRKHWTFIFLILFCQKGKEREHNQHWSRKCWEKSGIKLKRRLKARTCAIIWSSAIHSRKEIRLWCLHHTEITGQRGRECKSLFSPFTVPLTSHHLYCQTTSARLVSALASINHCSAGWRGPGQKISQPTSADYKVFIDQDTCWWE